MLLLKSPNGSFGLENDKTYIIGRESSDICLADRSVSRKHAEISIKGHVAFIKDLGSSNFTQLNGTLLRPQKEYKIKFGSQLQLGKDSTFILQQDQIVITASSLSPEQKVELDAIRKKLNCQIVANWTPQVTHVVIPTLVLTKKVVCALIKKQHIVTIEYFKCIIEKMSRNLQLPQESFFRVNSFEDNMRQTITVDYDMDRSRLFKHKVFVFINNEHMKRMEAIIKLSGGKTTSMDDNNVSIQKKHLADRNIEYVLVMNDGYTQNINETFDELIAYAKRLKRRAIPVQEIALAVVYGSAEVYSNSSFDKLALIMTGKRGEIKGVTIVAETQATEKVAKPCTYIVPATEDCALSEIARAEDCELSEVAMVEEMEPIISQKRPADDEPIVDNTQLKRGKRSSTIDDEVPSTSSCVDLSQASNLSNVSTSLNQSLSRLNILKKPDNNIPAAFNFNMPAAVEKPIGKLTLKRKRDSNAANKNVAKKQDNAQYDAFSKVLSTSSISNDINISDVPKKKEKHVSTSDAQQKQNSNVDTTNVRKKRIETALSSSSSLQKSHYDLNQTTSTVNKSSIILPSMWMKKADIHYDSKAENGTYFEKFPNNPSKLDSTLCINPKQILQHSLKANVVYRSKRFVKVHSQSYLKEDMVYTRQICKDRVK